MFCSDYSWAALADDVQLAVEDSASRLWEEQNADDFPGWDDSVEEIMNALDALLKAQGHLEQAAKKVEGSTEEDRIISLLDDISEMASAVKDQIGRMQ